MQETIIVKYGKQYENNLIGAAEQLLEYFNFTP